MSDELTAEWRERGAGEDQRSAVPPSRSEEGREFAILTDILHQGTFDISTDDHRAVKALKKRDSLRDNMTSLELA